MYQFFKNSIIGLLIFSILVSTSISCTKEDNVPQNEQTTEIANGQKAWWWIVVVAAVVIAVTEGQYSSTTTTTTNPDGSTTTTTTTSCKGLGHCAHQVIAGGNGTGGEIPVSSIQYNEPVDFYGQGMLAQDSNGHIIYGMEYTQDNRASVDRFFYRDEISISRPLVIDNPIVLEQLNVTDKIVVQGDYRVHTAIENGKQLKYIIIR